MRSLKNGMVTLYGLPLERGRREGGQDGKGCVGSLGVEIHENVMVRSGWRGLRRADRGVACQGLHPAVFPISSTRLSQATTPRCGPLGKPGNYSEKRLTVRAEANPTNGLPSQKNVPVTHKSIFTVTWTKRSENL